MVNTQTSKKFDRLIVLLNPKSTNYDRAKKMVAEITDIFTAERTEILQASPGGKQDDIYMLRKYADKFGPSTLFCVAAGDGTVSSIINFLLTDSTLPEKARLTVLLPLWGGNGNDLATTLNGHANMAKIKSILDKGNVVAAHPLYCRVAHGKEEQKLLLAGNYMAFGATGLMCANLNSKAHRESFLFNMPGGAMPQSIITTWRSLYSSLRFAIEESGKRRMIYELEIVNGPIVGKYYHVPVELLDDHFYVDTWISKIPLGTPLAGILSMWRRTLRRSKNHYFKKVEFTIKDSTWAQFDAEPVRIKPDTKIEIGMYDRPFYALSTELVEK